MHPLTLDGDLLHAARPIDDPLVIAEINDLKIQLNDNRNKIIYGRYTLFFLTALVTFAGYVMYRDSGGEVGQLIVSVGIAAIYLLCALFTFRYHFAALAFGLGIYLFDHLTTLFIDPGQFLQGWGMKVAIITGLTLGVYASYERRGLMRRFDALPVSDEEKARAGKLGSLQRTKQVKRGEMHK